MKTKLFIYFYFIFTLSFYPQDSTGDDCKCCTNPHNQFDFWLGEWTVSDTLGGLIGTNTIIKQYGHCLIKESWVSNGKNRGTSYNYFNPSDTTWNQLWLDNQGAILKLKGNYIDGKMILKSDLQKGQRVAWYYNRIIWEKLENGNVIQTWDILNDKHILLTNLFTGIYKRK